MGKKKKDRDVERGNVLIKDVGREGDGKTFRVRLPKFLSFVRNLT